MTDTALTDTALTEKTGASGGAKVERVLATPAALELIATLTAEYGPVLFHQSGGCCDGSSPMCYPRGDYIVGDRDVRMGEIGGAPFYMSPSQFEYWQHTQLIIDVVPGRGGMFSLENGRDQRFLTRSRLFAEDELDRLVPTRQGADG
ncbi:DUF779 domain-containing protein [Starkeya koreensis]|uniref:DUF779 domain-containing protein n=1 Tax=Ancylobacter koreensis TaxID=266121 RepID=A0ABT0DPT9_9HYPH|nr:DUF779 domain-containing protein [Ancylobacter koreensis]MCK0209295.1 DUF779 domain-containing protein [Ancylobacter koreensis]